MRNGAIKNELPYLYNKLLKRWNCNFKFLTQFLCCDSTKRLRKAVAVQSFEQLNNSCCCSSLTCVQLIETTWTIARRVPCPSLFPGVCSNSCPLSWWCYPTISSSVIPFSSCLQSFPASRSFPMSQFFTSGGQSIGASDSVSVLLVNVQGWFPIGLTVSISLLSKGISRVFSSTTVQRHQTDTSKGIMILWIKTKSSPAPQFEDIIWYFEIKTKSDTF